jgi:hypothetical protein
MNNQKGRKVGAKNKFTAEQKKEMREVLLPLMRRMKKDMAAMEPYQRMKVLLQYLPYLLTKGTIPQDEVEIQEIIFKELEGHYKRLRIYFSHVPPEKKAELMRGFMVFFSVKQKSSVIGTIRSQLGEGDRTS